MTTPRRKTAKILQMSGKWGAGEQWFGYAVIERSRDSPTGAGEKIFIITDNCQLLTVKCQLSTDN
ncbi:MAG TPA: hypothetical protein V6D25_04365 [Leptolyngbyaceae cyanobacterium]